MEKTVSAGICAHNEEETIGQLIEQIESEEIDLEEILVVVAGDDSTSDIVQEKSEKYGNVVLIEEETREGQTAAQNKILSQVSSNLVFLIDGDGTISEGSLDNLMEAYDGDSIPFGRVVADMDDWWMRPVVESLWSLYHDICLEQPKFSTQLGLIPTDLVEGIPSDVTLDDEYLGIKAREKGLHPQYVPSAIKYQNLPESFRFYFNQRRKNWAGRTQLQKKYSSTCHDRSWLAKTFLKQYLTASPSSWISLTLMGVIEASAYLSARLDVLRGRYHQIWYRE